MAAAGLLAAGLCGLCALQFGVSEFAPPAALIAAFTAPGVLIGVGLVLLGRRIGWRKADGVAGFARALRLTCAGAMIAIGLFVCLYSAALALGAITRRPLDAALSLGISLAAAGIFYGGLKLWPDPKPPIRTDVF